MDFQLICLKNNVTPLLFVVYELLAFIKRTDVY
jgi:hypothetical protein